MSTLWNPADKSTGITLSNGNHTATTNTGGNFGVRGTPTTHASGKWYLEFNNILSGTSGGGFYGIGNSSTSFGSNGLMGATPGGLASGSNSNSSSGSPDGHTVGLAFDLDGHAVWETYDGVNWTGSSVGGTPNPNTLTAGLAFGGTFTGPGVPYAWLQNVSANSHVTINCGDSAFSFSVPTNFLGWDVPAIITKTQGTLMC